MTNPTQTARLLRLPAVIDRTGLKKTTLYRLMGKEEFPAQVRLSPGCVGWHEAAVNDWIASRQNAG